MLNAGSQTGICRLYDFCNRSARKWRHLYPQNRINPFFSKFFFASGGIRTGNGLHLPDLTLYFNRGNFMNIFDAIEFAARAHRGQFRKTTKIPYLIHPLRVAQILIEAHASDDLVIAGLLHDTLEDTPVTRDEIHQTFGAQVAAWVAGVSEPDKSNSWEFRKQHTLVHLNDAPIELVLIACADKLDNIESIRKDHEKVGDDCFKRFNRPKTQQQWYYFELVRLFNTRLAGTPFDDLAARFEMEVNLTFGS